MFQGIRGRIVSTYLFLFFITMVALGIILMWLLQNYFLWNMKQNMANQADLVSSLLKKEIALGEGKMLESSTRMLADKLSMRITVISIEGRVITDSEKEPERMESHAGRPEVKKALSGKVGSDIRLSATTGIKTMYVAIPAAKYEQIRTVTRVSLPLQEMNYIFLKLRGLIFTGILIATIMTFFLSLKLAKGLTEPIESIRKGTQRIAAGDWNTRVYSGSKDEIGELGRNINNMTKILKEKIDEVSQEKSRLENILNTIVSGVIVIDNYSLVRIINPAAEEIFGINRTTAEGKHNLEVIRHFGLNEQVEKCLIQEKIIEYEFAIHHLEDKVLQCYIAPVYRDDNISGITMVFHDITRLRKLEQMRADFVANASHELRTPLTIIKGYIETLLNGALEDRSVSEKFMAVIDKEADRLQRLVDELLVLSRLESQRDTSEQSVNLHVVIDSVFDGMKQRFEAKKISFDLQLPKELPEVKANPDRIKQVLVNLLDNALKYTPEEGRVQLKAYEEGKNIRVIIEDTGMGIPARDLSRIFERFYRVDKARTRRLGGFGLGLSIVKHIVEMYGGQIGVDSIPEKGSSFWFTLPKSVS
jgi:two-component system phosphate regulon sensor histidine kinase PhoR